MKHKFGQNKTLPNQENAEETTKQHQIEKHLWELKHFHNLTCFQNSISFGINILDNFSLHSTVSLYNLDLSFVCQHFSMPLHVFQSLLCVGYCDCWFYLKIFIIPSIISIGLCWCSPHAYNCILIIILLLILSWALIKLFLLIQWMFVIICIDWMMVV